MAHDVRAVANYVLDHADRLGVALTNAELSEVVYLILGWHLGARHGALAAATLEAGSDGPVVRELYAEFEKYGAGPILRKATRVDAASGRRRLVSAPFDLETAEFLHVCANEFLRMTADARRAIVCAGDGPWAAAEPGDRIPETALRDYFSAPLASEAQAIRRVA